MTSARLLIELTYFCKEKVLPGSNLSYVNMNLGLLYHFRGPPDLHTFTCIWSAAALITDNMGNAGMSADLPRVCSSTWCPLLLRSRSSVFILPLPQATFKTWIFGLSFFNTFFLFTYTRSPSMTPQQHWTIFVVTAIRENVPWWSGCSNAHWFTSM